jgi:hypothetical protein
MCGAISLITAPKEKRQISASLDLNKLTIFTDVDSSYHFIILLPSENFDGANICQFGNDFFIDKPILTPFLVMARTETFSILKICLV